MPCCFVVGCKTGNKRGEHGHLFTIPKNADERMFQKWISSIPKREDKHFDRNSKICHLHFDEAFLVKVDRVIMVDVVVAEKPRIHWKLTPEAYPTLFSNNKVPAYYNKPLQTRKPPALRTVITPSVTTPKPIIEIEILTSAADKKESSILDQEMDISQLKLITLPPTWMVQVRESSIRFIEMMEDTRRSPAVFFPVKQLEVFKNFYFKANVGRVDVSSSLSQIVSKENVESSLRKLISVQVCSGVSNMNMFNVWPSAYKQGSLWYSNDCLQVVLDTSVCDSCSSLKQTLRDAAETTLKKMQSTNQETSKKLKIVKKRVKAAQAKIKRLGNRNADLKRLHIQLKSSNKISLETEINSLDLPIPMKSAMLTSVTVAKAKSKYAVRYQADWLLQALLLKITSPKCYRKLRASKVLPLPDPSHLTRILSGIPCQFGFSPFVFGELESQFKNKPLVDCQIMLMCDEMGVQEGISFEKMTKKFKGYIDYAEFSEYAKERKSPKCEADHCLVFLIRFLNSNITQPIACFATRGAAPGNILAKMVISAIVRLENIGLQVVGFVSDGAATNKSMWRELGITTKRGSGIVNSITNPVEEGRQVFFLCDIPHILKWIRNNFFNKENVKWGEQIISWTYYKALYDVDNKSDLRIVPKLTPRDIAPGPFQKMSVASAAHVFSKSTANGLKAYREICQNNFFQKSEPTENFTRLLNDLFDACNGRIPMDGLRPGNTKYKIIEDFLAAMSPSDTYASDQTFVSLQVTLTSILVLTNYLCNVIGYHYVLAGKCNQDPLEKFFGLVRSFGGNDCHPTATSFSHIFRLLSVYFPTSRSIKGNVSKDEEYAVVTVSCIETLKSLRNVAKTEHERNNKLLEDTILSKIFYSPDQPKNIPQQINEDHGYSIPPISRCIVYQFSGFLAYKGKMFTKCVDCIESLIDMNPKTQDMRLTAMKDFGGLKYPSQALFNMINDTLEPSLHDKLSSPDAVAEFVPSFIENLPNMNAFGLGCTKEHSFSLVANLILYYVTVRLWFHVRNKNREVLRAGTKRRNQSKLAKLVK